MTGSELTEAERAQVVEAYDHEADAHCWQDHCEDGLWHAVAQIVAARLAPVEDDEHHWRTQAAEAMANQENAEALVEAGLALADEWGLLANLASGSVAVPVALRAHAQELRVVLGGAEMSAEGIGMEPRYRVKKINDPEGKHDDCRYFVLDPQHDPTARDALTYYASRTPNRALARDLHDWLDAEGGAS